jgi:transcriptional regulator with XRE-family HTH domain
MKIMRKFFHHRLKTTAHFMNIIASNLLQKREEKRYTQSYMAMHCHMSQPNYSDIERGKTEPSISQLKKFAEILETTVDELIFERGAETEHSDQKKRIDKKQTQPGAMTPEDKDTYIKILENQLRNVLK